jgi:hypothetical protein
MIGVPGFTLMVWMPPPLVVELQRPAAGLWTNATGARNVADAALAAKCETMVLILTDAAVNPTNVMGTSERCAESHVQVRVDGDPASAASGPRSWQRGSGGGDREVAGAGVQSLRHGWDAGRGTGTRHHLGFDCK